MINICFQNKFQVILYSAVAMFCQVVKITEPVQHNIMCNFSKIRCDKDTWSVPHKQYSLECGHKLFTTFPACAPSMCSFLVHVFVTDPD